MNQTFQDTQPLVSILLSVKDGEAYLSFCLKSIEVQTYTQWELIAVNDGSQDTTGEIMKKFQGQVLQDVKIITHTNSKGLTSSLNEASKKASGKYLARIDADDMWDTTKLAKQVRLLERDESVGVIGTWYENTADKYRRKIRLPSADKDIKKTIFRKNPFGHSCVLMRRSVFEKVGGYDITLKYAQDRDLWFRLLPHTRFANVPEYLVTRSANIHTSRTNKKSQIAGSIRITIKYIRTYHASVIRYLFLIEPLLAYCAPNVIRTFVRRYL